MRVERGAEVGEVQVIGASGLRPARDGEDLDNVGFVFFSDPDGNGWAVQQISARDQQRGSGDDAEALSNASLIQVPLVESSKAPVGAFEVRYVEP